MTDDHRTTVLERIDAQRDELIGFLQQYVRIRSINPTRNTGEEPSGEGACQLWLADRLREFGCFDPVDVWEESEDRPNVAAVLRAAGPDAGAGLMFNGHADTVDVTPEQRAAWTGDPWSAEIRDGNLYGRGSTDMKAGNSAFIWAAKVIGELGIPLERDVQLTVNVGEEAAEADVGALSLLRRGYGAPLIVNAEPTNLDVCRSTVGWMYFRITVDGRELHPATRHQAIYPQPHGVSIDGVDAIHKMHKVIGALMELERDWGLHQRHPLVPPGALNLCPLYIRGGSHRSAMSESCEVEYSAIFHPSLHSSDVLGQVEDVLRSLGTTDTWLREHPPRLEAPIVHRILEPIDVPEDHWGVQALVGSCRNALGSDPVVRGFPAVSDANILSEDGLTTIICGPGDIGCRPHGTDEYVPVQQVIDAAKVYADLILEVCGRGRGTT